MSANLSHVPQEVPEKYRIYYNEGMNARIDGYGCRGGCVPYPSFTNRRKYYAQGWIAQDKTIQTTGTI